MITNRALLGVGLILVSLEAISYAFAIPSYVFAPPSRALLAIQRETGIFASAFAYTLGNAFAGFVLASVLASVMIFGAYLSKSIEGVVVTLVDALQSFPKESLFPIFILWVGFGPDGKILNSALLSFIPLFVASFDAIRNTRQDYVQLFRSFGNVSKLAELWHCRLPVSVPVLHSAVRLGFPLAVVGSVLGEFLGGGEGLGHIIITSGIAFRIDRAFAAIYILAVAGVILLAVIDLVFRLQFRRYFLVSSAQ